METIKKIFTLATSLPYICDSYFKYFLHSLAIGFFMLSALNASAADNAKMDGITAPINNNAYQRHKNNTAIGNTFNATNEYSDLTPQYPFKGLHMPMKMAPNKSSLFIPAETRARYAISDNSSENIRSVIHSADLTKNTQHFITWKKKFGSWKHINNHSYIAHLNHSTQGFFLGTNLSSASDWYLDAIANFNRSSFKTRNLYHSMLDNYYHAGLYSGTQHNRFSLHTGATYTGYRHNNKTGSGNLSPNFGEKIKSSYKAETIRIFGELDYNADIKSVQLRPFVNLAYVNLHTKKQIRENSVTKLAQASSNTDVFFTTLGIHSATTMQLAKASLVVSGTAGWRYAFNNLNPRTTIHFVNEGDPFTVSGIPAARNAAVVETGLSYIPSSNTAMEVTYTGQFNTYLADQTLRANIYMQF